MTQVTASVICLFSACMGVSAQVTIEFTAGLPGQFGMITAASDPWTCYVPGMTACRLRLTDLVARVRAEIGDPSQPFRTTALGDGRTQWYDLPKQEIQVITEAAIVSNSTFTVLTDASAATAWSSTTAYTAGAFVTYNGAYFQCATGNTGQTPGSGGDWTDISSSAYVINDQLGQIQLGVAGAEQRHADHGRASRGHCSPTAS